STAAGTPGRACAGARRRRAPSTPAARRRPPRTRCGTPARSPSGIARTRERSSRPARADSASKRAPVLRWTRMLGGLRLVALLVGIPGSIVWGRAGFAGPSPSREVRNPPRVPMYLKGQLHMHTNNSGDSATPPADAVRWYAAHGYDFVVVTDHNRI